MEFLTGTGVFGHYGMTYWLEKAEAELERRA
jgi:hypothetical protein